MSLDKVMVMTSKSRGGIAQFAFFLAKELHHNAQIEEVVLVVPRESEYSVSGIVHIEFYDQVDTMHPSVEKFAEVIAKIDKHKPTHIIFSELSVSNMQLAAYIKERYHLTVTVHDAFKRPEVGFMEMLKERYFVKTMKKNIDYFDKIGVLSDAVLEDMNSKFKINQDKVIKMKLCSHLHINGDQQFGNMIGEDYFMFFGRINKSKGLITLFEAYAKDRNHLLPKLVIAGKGKFTKKEQVLFEQIKNQVILMKAYITDETLASLMSYSRAVILPYFDASQSGVIPIAYQFDKPVVVSDCPGLAEYVIDGETGYVFPKGESTQLYTVLKKLMIGYDDIERMEPLINQHYLANFNWTEHVDRLVAELV